MATTPSIERASLAIVAVVLLYHTLWRRRRRTNIDALPVDSLTDRVLQRLNTQCDDAVTFARADSQTWRAKYERALSERDEWREKVVDLSALLAKVGQMKQAAAGGDSVDSLEDGECRAPLPATPQASHAESYAPTPSLRRYGPRSRTRLA